MINIEGLNAVAFQQLNLWIGFLVNLNCADLSPSVESVNTSVTD